MEATTLVRMGIFEGDFESSLLGYNPQFEKINIGLDYNYKYGLFIVSEPQLIIASNSDRLSEFGHNCMLTVTSYDPERNMHVARDIEGRLRVNLDDPIPIRVKEGLPILNLAFEIFKAHPDQVARLLRLIQ